MGGVLVLTDTEGHARVSKRTRLLVGAVLALVVALVALELAFPFVWISQPIQGRVTERTSGKPVDGAVVMARWPVKALEGAVVGQLEVSEVVTDAAGRFTIPGWGPRFWLGWGRLRQDVPQVWVLHRAYMPQPARNEAAGYGDAGMFLHAKLRDPELAPAADAAAQSQALDTLTQDIALAFSGSPCNFRRIPRLLKEIDVTRAQLAQQGQHPTAAFGGLPARCTSR
jgi:hypothetical protein